MNLSCGIVGLPNVGKSTLFNALLSKQIANVSNYPFCTIEPNVGIIEVPDERLDQLQKVVQRKKAVPSVVKFVDIAGLVKNAHQGEGLGNQFLAHIREVHLIIHLIRYFEDSNVIREGSKEPKHDYEIVKTELCLADLKTLEKQTEIKGTKDKKEILKWQTILKAKKALEKGIELRDLDWNQEEKEALKGLFLLTLKPQIVVLNIDEEDLDKIDQIKKDFADLNPLIISAKIESELSELDQKEREEYLKSLNLRESGLKRLIKRSFDQLNLIAFFTVGDFEVRSWTIQKGTPAQKAAGVIHTDFEKGFVKAAVVELEDFIKYKSWKSLKDGGKLRYEGKNYQIKDGELVHFMVNQ